MQEMKAIEKAAEEREPRRIDEPFGVVYRSNKSGWWFGTSYFFPHILEIDDNHTRVIYIYISYYI